MADMTQGAGTGAGLTVQLELLDAEARALREAATAVGAGSRQLGPLLQAAEALDGWRSGAALQQCTAAWSACLTALGGDLADRSDRLRTTAGNYRAAEARAAEGFSRLLPSLPTGPGAGPGP
jgi:hypothetical protein